MKKPKRPFEWQEQNGDSPEDVGFDLDVDEEEEIIELEDVLEVSDENGASRESTEPDLEGMEPDDLEELSEFDLKDLELDFESEDENLLDDNLLAQFKLGEERASEEQLLKAGEDSERSGLLSEEAESLPEPKEAEMPSVEVESAIVEPMEIASEPVGPAELSDELAEQPITEEKKPTLDEFVAQIESRLLEAVQQMVETRLPEIVRTVLREEIDRLQRDSDTEEA